MLRASSDLQRFDQLRDSIRIEDSPPPSNFTDRIINVVDRVTKAPGAVSRTADNLNDYLAEKGKEIKTRASQTAEQNITENKISGSFRKLGDWLQKGENKWYAIAGLLIVIFLVRKA